MGSMGLKARSLDRFLFRAIFIMRFRLNQHEDRRHSWEKNMKQPVIICLSFFCVILSTPNMAAHRQHSALAGEKPYAAYLQALNDKPAQVEISHERQFKISITFNNSNGSKKISKTMNEVDVKQFIIELEKVGNEQSKNLVEYLRSIS